MPTLRDGQEILELGCGWGSLSLWMAERFPNARITAVSNSRPQREHIEHQATLRQLRNLKVITADMNDFAIDKSFDRIVSIEMFEHMANWQGLLARVRRLAEAGWATVHPCVQPRPRALSLRPRRRERLDRAAFLHRRHHAEPWLDPSLSGLFAVQQEWRWSGTHYRRTALDWLANYDANAREIGVILRKVYGRDAGLWRRRWRMFFLATAELFGYDDGRPWGVSHYLLRAAD
jgi:cyclopropane-fatty-acyl-phospholipid synthase